MTREQYLNYWRGLSPEEKRAEIWRWVMDCAGGVAMVGAFVGIFAVLPGFVGMCWSAWAAVMGWV